MHRQLFATRLDRSTPPGPQLERAADMASTAILARLEAGLPVSERDMQALADLLLFGSAKRWVQS